MKEFFRPLWERIRFQQKREWHAMAYSFFNQDEENLSILDAGAGTGEFISLNPDAVMGMDRNQESLRHCRSKGFTVVQADVKELPFQNRAFKGVHYSHVIEHFHPRDVHAILKEADRVLKENGHLIIRSPLLWPDFYSDLTHVRPYNPEAITSYLIPSEKARTLDLIGGNYDIVRLKWRYKPWSAKIKSIHKIFRILNRWGFPWLKKNGYMLVMRKTGERTA